MQNWTKEHARFVGRVIFANFLNLPLENYQDFIEEMERDIRGRGYGKSVLSINVLSKAKIYKGKNVSPKVIASIEKLGKGTSIRYTYKGFNMVYNPKEESPFYYKLRRISSRNELTHRIIKGIIEHQKRFLNTGDPIDLVPFSQAQLLIDNSWTSRLVNRISVITPSGEERTLRSFFPTQKDINKRFIKQLLDKEREPLMDNEIVARLKSEYGIRLSRHSVGHCRKDMGIPPASMRLSGYKYPPLSANFSALYPLVLFEVLKNAPSCSGIYEFQVEGREIEYHKGKTRVIYIGSTRNIRKRLREHLGKNNKNGSIREFLNKSSCSFRFIQFSKNWKEEEKRLYNLFVTTYGAPPGCNKVRPYY